jgi:hypothetical protein
MIHLLTPCAFCGWPWGKYRYNGVSSSSREETL